jgi:Kef-type K+ transport system membrane component KefB
MPPLITRTPAGYYRAHNATLTGDITIGLAAALTVVAIVTKLVCGLPAGPGRNRLAVGLAMVPRGEVGLIFASVGKGLGVVTDAEFSAIVIMVIVTTLITPPALKWALARRPAAAAASVS